MTKLDLCQEYRVDLTELSHIVDCKSQYYIYLCYRNNLYRTRSSQSKSQENFFKKSTNDKYIRKFKGKRHFEKQQSERVFTTIY